MPRGISPVHEICYLWKQLWEQHHIGEQYHIMWGFDSKYAKELEGIEKDEIIRRAKIYFDTAFYESCKHSLQAFVKNFNSFVPQTRRPKQPDKPKTNQRLKILCECKTEHYSNELCPTCYPLCKQCNTQHATEQSCEDAKNNMDRLNKILQGGNGRKSETKQLNELL